MTARIGIIINPRSHRHRLAAGLPPPPAEVLSATPRTRDDLRTTLADFARAGVDTLIIDGGDGTVRDALTCAGEIWRDAWPRLLVVPSGKTNALALDLGMPAHWHLEDALATLRDGGSLVERSPIEIAREGEDQVVRGFLLGAGAFVDATELAQRAHRRGAFRGVAVGIALAWALAQTAMGSNHGQWRRGTRMALRFPAEAKAMHGAALASDAARYMLFASTLTRLPLGLKPFGTPRGGLKVLFIDAPLRAMARAGPLLLGGSETAWLEAHGYHRIDTPSFDLTLDGGFILDGELFAGGTYRLREGAPIRFVVP